MSHQGQGPGVAVISGQQDIGDRVFDEVLSLGVELDRPGNSVGNVAEVAERTADMADFDVGGRP